jgi:uncharacterized protein YyaL (SSP411 family)
MVSKIPNRLIHEKSPYLLQHAHNPVDWYPWGEEAFDIALKDNKLIFLSVGYSTCHWCHVMAHESFEDPDVAWLLNEVFVCIKIDREERPDIDKVYMSVCQILTGSGGWPLTVVLTPDRRPIFAATYIPKESRFGRIGMLELIPKIREVWANRREEVLKSADQFVTAISRDESGSQSGILSRGILDEAYEDLHGRFDKANGGFGLPPKFPMPHQMMFLLRYWRWTGQKKALEMVEKTLQSMRRGGIYDHVGFGFHRYSTDERWLVPHFEKMLYDQALMSLAYTEAYQSTRNEAFKKTACEIFAYVLRDMKSLAGGFYTAEDADSEKEEGRYYLWTRREVEALLEPSEAELIIKIFQVKKEGNFIDPLAGGKTSGNILHLEKPAPELASMHGISEESLRQRLAAARLKLFAARERRIRPHKDDKVLTDWNGLMIAALAKGAKVFADMMYLKASRNAINFILKKMRELDGRLLHRHRDGESAIMANLDDYAFLIWGLIECYEASFDVTFLQTVLKLQEDLTKHFWDGRKGGYYFTPDDGENLIVRQKEIYDGAIPSGNSVAMLNLIRLARMTGSHELEAQAIQISQTFAGSIKQSPAGHTQFMIAQSFLENPSHEIVIAGKPGAEDTEKMIGELRRYFLPNTVVLFRPAGKAGADIVRIAPFTKDLEPLHGKATAYICSGFVCHNPTTDIKEMLGLLNI